MRRREVIAGLAPRPRPWLAATAQPKPPPMIGFLSGRTPDEAANVLASFHCGLAETGYVEGRNVAVEYRWAEGRYERLPAVAAELVERRIAVIAATGGGVAGLAAKAATAIPIVFASGGDAVRIGLVESLNRPGGNVTGVNLVFGALAAKRLELLREVIPSSSSTSGARHHRPRRRGDRMNCVGSSGLATVREWNKRLEHQAHSRPYHPGGYGLPVATGAVS